MDEAHLPTSTLPTARHGSLSALCSAKGQQLDGVNIAF